MRSVFENLYDQYHHDVFRFLFYMVKNRETAEDLMQDVYVKVFQSQSHFEGKSSEKTWLFSIARNTAIDHFRKDKNWKKRILENFDWAKETIKDDQPLPEEMALLNDEMQIVYRSLHSCTVDQRSVLVLRYIESLSIIETAEVLGWSVGKVKTTQHRALKVVRKFLEEQQRKGESNGEKKQEK